jgi:uncharacterized damage-inducible protein DinB
MTARELQGLFDYSYWANAKLFEAIARLTPEEFTQTVAGSYGSVRNTMVHVLSAEWGWMDRCGGTKRGAPLNAVDFPTTDSLITTWRRTEANVREFLASLTDADLGRIVEFAIGSGPKYAMPLGELMHHAAVHAVHHRGQVALLLRLLGQTPGNFDILFYYAGKTQAQTT